MLQRTHFHFATSHLFNWIILLPFSKYLLCPWRMCVWMFYDEEYKAQKKNTWKINCIKHRRCGGPQKKERNCSRYGRRKSRVRCGSQDWKSRTGSRCRRVDRSKRGCRTSASSVVDWRLNKEVIVRFSG